MSRWRLNFPVLQNQVDRKDYLVIWMKPITPARADLDPTHCHVVGLNAEGQHCKFTATLAAWHKANMTPVTLVEASSNPPSPAAALVDGSGRSVLT